MKRVFAFVILSHFILSRQGTYESQSFTRLRYRKVYMNAALDSRWLLSSFQTPWNGSAVGCTILCMQTESCKSINYSPTSRVCEMNSAALNSSQNGVLPVVVSKHGFEYWQITEQIVSEQKMCNYNMGCIVK